MYFYPMGLGATADVPRALPDSSGTSPHHNVQDSEPTTSDFVTKAITPMTNLGDHFSPTSSAKLQRIDVQKAMLACNHLSRQCNKSLEDIDAFHMPPPQVPVTTAAKRIQSPNAACPPVGL